MQPYRLKIKFVISLARIPLCIYLHGKPHLPHLRITQTQNVLYKFIRWFTAQSEFQSYNMNTWDIVRDPSLSVLRGQALCARCYHLLSASQDLSFSLLSIRRIYSDNAPVAKQGILMDFCWAFSFNSVVLLAIYSRYFLP